MLMPAVFGENLIDDFFDDFDFPFGGHPRTVRKAPRQAGGYRPDQLMRTDIRETKDAYLLSIELPGYKKENIQASIEDGTLTVTASRTEEETDAHFLRRERYTGSVQRAFYVGEEVKQEDVQARFEHGVLHLVVPKKEAVPQVEKSRYISID